MPLPTQGSLHVDVPLTNLLVGYKNTGYIADDCAPIVPVDKQTNIIPRLNQSYFFRDDAKVRAPGSKSRGGGYTVDNTLSYYCPRYSYRHEIPDEVRDNADQPYDVDRESTFLVGDKLGMARERAFATNNFTTGVWGADKVGGTDFNQWSIYSGSTPLEDIFTYKDSVEALISVEPNTFIIGKQVLVGSGGTTNGGGLLWHPEILDVIKYTQRAVVTTDLLASLFGFEKFLVGRSIYTSTPEGVAETSVTYTRIWGKNCLMLYNTPGPSILKPPAIGTFVWNRVANAIQYMKRMRNEEIESDILEGNSYFTQKVIVKNAGVFLSGAVA